MEEILIISRSQFDSLINKVDRLINLAEGGRTSSDPREIITNDQLIAEFGLSKKTAQNWRTNGLIPFMRVGRKIYYKMDDVIETLEGHRHESFKRKTKRTFV